MYRLKRKEQESETVKQDSISASSLEVSCDITNSADLQNENKSNSSESSLKDSCENSCPLTASDKLRVIITYCSNFPKKLIRGFAV